MAPQPGGGGLVILPHKSWNVWNQDNKSKVARDEKANAKLIEAKEKCRKQTLQQIRFEKLNGKVITKQEEEDRIQYALDNMDISDYIKDDSMREIAGNINDKMKREENEHKSSSNRKKRRMNDTDFVNEEFKKYLPRKRHKRNDVSIIEDHYSERNKFEFDPNQYATKHRRSKHSDTQTHKASNHSNSHFSLFDERNLKKNKDDEIFKEDERFRLGRTEIDQRKRSKKSWYLMTSQKEKERRNLMKADEIQRSLPRRLREYECNTDKLKEKAMYRKHSMDPMELMHRLMKTDKKRKPKFDDDDEEDDYHRKDSLKSKKERKKKRKKSRKDRKKHTKYGEDSADDGDEMHKRKRSRHKKHKSSKKKRKRS